jgi:hypothetical protein
MVQQFIFNNAKFYHLKTSLTLSLVSYFHRDKAIQEFRQIKTIPICKRHSSTQLCIPQCSRPSVPRALVQWQDKIKSISINQNQHNQSVMIFILFVFWLASSKYFYQNLYSYLGYSRLLILNKQIYSICIHRRSDNTGAKLVSNACIINKDDKYI